MSRYPYKVLYGDFKNLSATDYGTFTFNIRGHCNLWNPTCFSRKSIMVEFECASRTKSYHSNHHDSMFINIPISWYNRVVLATPVEYYFFWGEKIFRRRDFRLEFSFSLLLVLSSFHIFSLGDVPVLQLQLKHPFKSTVLIS